MIRINLLPVRQEQRRQFGKQQLFLGVLLLGVEMAVLFTWHRGLVEERNEVQGRVDAIQAEVNALDSQSQELTRLNEQKQQLEDLQNILEDLEANRAGPVQVLDELKVMLNPPANDLQRVAQDRMGWDTQWDPTNIWLTEFAEDEQELTVSGKAMSNDDVAEFLVRLANSPYFDNVLLSETTSSTEAGLGAVFKFDLTANVNYGLVAGDEE